jgi:hypothetical protein
MVQKLAKRNHIHTLEYSSRSKLCGLLLNSSEGRDSVADLKTFANSSEEDQPTVRWRKEALC